MADRNFVVWNLLVCAFSAVCGLMTMTLNPIRRFAMERRNVMVCVTGLAVLVVMGISIPVADAEDYRGVSVEKMGKSLQSAGDEDWLDDSYITKEFLDVKLYPDDPNNNLKIGDILIQLYALYASSDEFIPSRRDFWDKTRPDMNFADWLDNVNVQRAWLETMEDISDDLEAVRDALEALELSEQTEEDFGFINESIKNIDDPIGMLTFLLKEVALEHLDGTKLGEMIDKFDEILSYFKPSSLLAKIPETLGQNCYDVRQAYLLYYIGSKIVEDWSSKEPYAPLVDMMMKTMTGQEDSLYHCPFYHHMPYSIGYPYNGGYEYSGSEIRTGTQLKEKEGEEFYREFAKILFFDDEDSDDPTDSQIKQAQGTLRMLSSIFQYFTWVEEMYPNEFIYSLEEILPTIKVLTYNFNEDGTSCDSAGYQILDAPEIIVYSIVAWKYSRHMGRLKDFFAQQISTALRGEKKSGIFNNNYFIGRGIGFSFLDTNNQHDNERFSSILTKMKAAYEDASKFVERPMHPDRDYNQGLAVAINGGWMQRFKDAEGKIKFALYVTHDGEVFTVYDDIKDDYHKYYHIDFLKYYEGDNTKGIPAERPKLGMPKTDCALYPNRFGEFYQIVQYFEKGSMLFFDGKTDITITERKAIANATPSPNGEIRFNGELQESLKVRYGGSCSVNVDAKDGYLIDTLTVTNTDNNVVIKDYVIDAKSYSFELYEITTNYAVNATFVEDEQYGNPIRVISPTKGKTYPTYCYLKLKWDIVDRDAGISSSDNLYFSIKSDSKEDAVVSYSPIAKSHVWGTWSLDIPIPAGFPEADDYRIHIYDENKKEVGCSYQFRINEDAPFPWLYRKKILWDAAKLEANRIKISLYQLAESELRDDDYKFVKTLVRSIENSGNGEIQIPAGYSGNGYRILVEGIGTDEQTWIEGGDFSIENPLRDADDVYVTPIVCSVISGEWKDPVTWGGVVPGPNDIVEIADGTTVTISSVSSIEIKGLIIDGTVENASGVHPMMIVNGDVTNEGRLRRNTASGGGLSVKVYGNIFTDNGYWDPTHTELAGSGSKTVAGELEGETVTIAGDFELSGEAVFDTKVFFSKRTEAVLTVNSSVTFKELVTDAMINGNGTVEITRKMDGDIQGSIANIIPPVTHHITLTANTGGRAVLSEEDVLDGEDTTIDIEPYGGYEIEKVEVFSQGDIPELLCSGGHRYCYTLSGDEWVKAYTFENGVLTFTGENKKTMKTAWVRNLTADCEVVVTFQYVGGGSGTGSIVLNPTIRSVSDGQWDYPSVWSEGRVPNENDVVEIDHDVECRGATIAGLQVNSGASLTGEKGCQYFSLYVEGNIVNNGIIEGGIYYFSGHERHSKLFLLTSGSIDTVNGILTPYRAFFKGESARVINGMINTESYNSFDESFTLSGNPIFKGESQIRELTINDEAEFETIKSGTFNGEGTLKITGDCFSDIFGSISKIIFDGNIHVGKWRDVITVEPDVEITANTVIQNAGADDKLLTFNGNVTNYGTIASNDSGCLYVKFNGAFDNYGTLDNCGTETYTIEIDWWRSYGGSVFLDGEDDPEYMITSYGKCLPVEKGESRTFTFIPNEGYAISYIGVDSHSLDTSLSSYTFSNISEDHTLKVGFQPTHTITVEDSENGNVSPDGDITVLDRKHQIFYFTPDLGYKVSTIWIDGEPIENYSSYYYTFSRVEEDHTLRVEFEPVWHTITASAGEGGSISPSGDTEIQQGYDQTFTITPDTGYQIAELLVDGQAADPQTSYTFSSVTGNHSISVSFEKAAYLITATAGDGGSISPSGEVSVTHGHDQEFLITPDEGYKISEVLADETSVGAVTTYAFTDVTGNHSLTASFELTDHTIMATAGEGGSISPSGDVGVTHGSDQEFTIMPDEGYEILELLVDDAPAVVTDSAHTFQSVTGPHTIAVSFRLKDYTITATAGDGGDISPKGDVTVSHGSDQLFEITPDEGYDIAQVLVDDTSVELGDTGYTFSDVTDHHTIVASFVSSEHTITITAGQGGSISPTGEKTVSHGDSLELTITPDEGYEVSHVLVDGASVGAVTSHTLTDIREDHTVSVSFVGKTYTITASVGVGGIISPAGDVSVNHGGSQTFTIMPNTGYEVADVLVNGVSAGTVTSYPFTDVDGDHTISVIFKVREYTITASAGANGTISPSGTLTVTHGSDQEFTITPATGYQVADVLVDGTSVGAVTSYPLTDISGDHSVSASFEVATYTVSATCGENGSISPAGDLTLTHGDDQTFTITPDTGYVIVSVVVDGESVGAVTEYAFTSVTEDHTIHVTFTDPSSNHIIGFIPLILPGYSVEVSISPDWAELPHGGSQAFTIDAGLGNQLDIIDPSTCECDFSVSEEFELLEGGAISFTEVVQSVVLTLDNVLTDCNIVILASEILPVIAPTSGENGRIEPSYGVTVSKGGSQTFTLDPGLGYTVGDVLVDGVSVGAVEKYTFTNVTEDHTIHATFVEDPGPFTITVDITGNGVVEDDSGNTYVDGDTLTVSRNSEVGFTLIPDAGWRKIYSEFSYERGYSPSFYDSYHKTTDIVSDYTFTAYFQQDDGTLAVLVDPIWGGNIYPEGTPVGSNGYHIVTVSEGADQTFTFTPDADMKVSKVEGHSANTGESFFASASSTYTLSNVQDDWRIFIDFVEDDGTNCIHARTGEGGSISPDSGDWCFSVNDGDSQTFTFTPEPGYYVEDVHVDGASVGAVSSYTFENVTGGHDIHVNFMPN